MLEGPRQTISEANRRDILDFMSAGSVRWSGRLDEVAFLERLWGYLLSVPSPAAVERPLPARRPTAARGRAPDACHPVPARRSYRRLRARLGGCTLSSRCRRSQDSLFSRAGDAPLSASARATLAAASADAALQIGPGCTRTSCVDIPFSWPTEFLPSWPCSPSSASSLVVSAMSPTPRGS